MQSEKLFTEKSLIIHADGSGMRRAFSGVCAYVCLFFFTRCLKTDAARMTKLNIEMFHHESWNLVYFAVKRLKVKVT